MERIAKKSATSGTRNLDHVVFCRDGPCMLVPWGCTPFAEKSPAESWHPKADVKDSPMKRAMNQF